MTGRQVMPARFRLSDELRHASDGAEGADTGRRGLGPFHEEMLAEETAVILVLVKPPRRQHR